MTSRLLVRFLAVLTISLGLVVPSAAGATAHDRKLPDRIALPNGFQPEGIDIGRRGQAYFGSRANGAIYRADLRTERGTIIYPGRAGDISVGLKIDQHGRLFVAGGTTGTAKVIDSRTGVVLRRYQLASGTTFINDVILTKRAAYFTDSQQAQLYVLPLGLNGALPAAGRVRTLKLTGDWSQIAGSLNANGIALTPDRRALLVVQSPTGYLFRVNPVTGVARRVDLGKTLLGNGDGLLVEGRTLYAVQNRLNQIAVVKLSRDGRRGRLVRTITSSQFDVPTTVASYRGGLYLPNARFTTPPTPTTKYWVTRVSAR